jgi:Flp pilus assembly pilin Flp
MQHRFGEEGQGLTEYGWTVVLIAILMMAVLMALGGATTGLWEKAWLALQQVFAPESEALLLPVRQAVLLLTLIV